AHGRPAQCGYRGHRRGILLARFLARRDLQRHAVDHDPRRLDRSTGRRRRDPRLAHRHPAPARGNRPGRQSTEPADRQGHRSRWFVSAPARRARTRKTRRSMTYLEPRVGSTDPHPPGPLPATAAKKSNSIARRAAIAGGVGTLIEYYDFAVYGFLAVTIAPL